MVLVDSNGAVLSTKRGDYLIGAMVNTSEKAAISIDGYPAQLVVLELSFSSICAGSCLEGCNPGALKVSPAREKIKSCSVPGSDCV